MLLKMSESTDSLLKLVHYNDVATVIQKYDDHGSNVSANKTLPSSLASYNNNNRKKTKSRNISVLG